METAGVERGERAEWKQLEWKRERGQNGNRLSGKGERGQNGNSWNGKGREGRMETG